MAEKKCRVTWRDKTFDYPVGTKYSELAKDFQENYDYPIVLAVIDGKLKELHHSLHGAVDSLQLFVHEIRDDLYIRDGRFQRQLFHHDPPRSRQAEIALHTISFRLFIIPHPDAEINKKFFELYKGRRRAYNKLNNCN